MATGVKRKGSKWMLYLKSGAEPATPTLPANYEKVVFLRKLGLGGAKKMIDANTFDLPNDDDSVDGRRSRTLSAEGVYGAPDDTTDSGQTELESAFEANDGDIYWLLTTGVIGTKSWNGRAGVEKHDLDFPDDELATFAATLKVRGAVTKTTIAS